MSWVSLFSRHMYCLVQEITWWDIFAKRYPRIRTHLAMFFDFQCVLPEILWRWTTCPTPKPIPRMWLSRERKHFGRLGSVSVVNNIWGMHFAVFSLNGGVHRRCVNRGPTSDRAGRRDRVSFTHNKWLSTRNPATRDSCRMTSWPRLQ